MWSFPFAIEKNSLQFDNDRYYSVQFPPVITWPFFENTMVRQSEIYFASSPLKNRIQKQRLGDNYRPSILFKFRLCECLVQGRQREFTT